MVCCTSTLVFIGVGLPAALYYVVYKLIPSILLQRKLDRWKSTPKGVVILHGLPRAITIPNASPFVLKLETYLRMTGIKYEYDSKDPFGPKGKSPWISLNGEHVADSQLAIDFLEKKFETNLNKSYSEEQLAIATLARVALEEHAFWGAALWAFVLDSAKNCYNVMAIKPKILIDIFIGRSVKNVAYYQGIGRHTPEEIQNLLTRDFRAVSKLLGNKKFFLGNEPCTDDAGIFAFLATTQWGLLQNSPYQRLVNDELQNVKEYCIRMKEKYWQDWDSLLAK